MTQDLITPDTLPEATLLGIKNALHLVALCGDDAPPEMVAYADRKFREAVHPGVAGVLFDHYTQPEPKRPRLTAPVRRGLAELFAKVDTARASDDVLRAAQWVHEEAKS